MKVVQLALDKHIRIVKNIDHEHESYTSKLSHLIIKVTDQCRDVKD